MRFDIDGTDIEWNNSGAGNWDEGANWQGSVVPGLGNRALVNNGGTVQVDATTSPSPQVTSFMMAEDAGTTGNFEMTGETMFADEARFGEGGNATASVTGGSLIVGGDSIFVGGKDAAGTGSLTVSGATTFISSGDDFQLGRIGSGTLNLQNGELFGVYTVVGKFGSGIWNQSGGLFNVTGDLEIGDGGNDSQIGIAGPREGTINLSGGVLQSIGSVAIGNRRGKGTVNVEGGTLAATGRSDSKIFVGRGMDSSAGQGGAVELRVTGAAGTIIANGDFLMNPGMVATSSTLVAEITSADHTTIKVVGNADISFGDLIVELNGYVPVDGDSWTLIEAGADIEAEKLAIADFIANNGYQGFDQAGPGPVGSLIGNFAAVDLPAGFSVSYTANEVILNYSAPGVLGDANGDGNFDFSDIEPFFLALTDLPTYMTMYPNVEILQLDMNDDGNVDFNDIEPFFTALTGGRSGKRGGSTDRQPGKR